ncbi:class I SAM-dependent methyltransferase [Lihuaxuella thermophila]|uniref:SAM-dependent methyltransferase, MidA family n=1 Tax=Lihuaxuella thermophila TaxID=1173111 RepID=A0A1H8DLE8_9BACL|nr:SAM-dependent methyltransferase [Lihuaxuella thermophila]SEN08053.1 SAM-dependent methyltransferase, MidA family [Lihuaxuella thermophila]
MPEELLSVIVSEIRQSGMNKIPFSRYMELALYHPKWGYYNREHPKLGREGDFFTNAHVGDIYGRVLSRFFLKKREQVNPQGKWAIVEMGAGDGRLAEQVAQGLLEAGQDPAQIHFYLVEKSPYHRKLQQARLAGLPVPFAQVDHIGQIPPYPFSIVYSNELVDAFPVHRIKKERGQLLEAYVAWDADLQTLTEVWIPLTNPGICAYLSRLSIRLPEGQQMEVHLAAMEWLKKVASWMKKGYLLTIDYGGRHAELLDRRYGTLRSYRHHRLSSDWYSRPGEMDITSHVNFEALEILGEDVGLSVLSYQSQSRFLLEAGILEWLPPELPGDPFTPEAKRKRAIQQLIFPQAMGEAFQVLLQAKGLQHPC